MSPPKEALSPALVSAHATHRQIQTPIAASRVVNIVLPSPRQRRIRDKGQARRLGMGFAQTRHQSMSYCLSAPGRGNDSAAQPRAARHNSRTRTERPVRRSAAGAARQTPSSYGFTRNWLSRNFHFGLPDKPNIHLTPAGGNRPTTVSAPRAYALPASVDSAACQRLEPRKLRLPQSTSQTPGHPLSRGSPLLLLSPPKRRQGWPPSAHLWPRARQGHASVSPSPPRSDCWPESDSC